MTENDVKNKENILVRLRRIEGQVRGVQRMIEEEAECSQILNQIAAIKSAVNQAGILVFEHHARECLLEAAQDNAPEENIGEIVTLMGRLIK